MSQAPNGGGAAASESAGSAESTDSIEWWSIPEVAAALGVRDRDVRSMLSDRSLLGVRREGRAPAIPAAFLLPSTDGEGSVVLPGLKGTIIQLADGGFDDAEIVSWLFRDNEELGSTPIEALCALRTHAVRRAAQALAF